MPISVLVVDDDPTARLAAALHCRSLGAQVLVAADAASALEVLERQPVDLVLLDCHMPGCDGWQAAREMRRRIPRRLCILALTADDGPESLARCRLADMDGCLFKPLDPEALRPYVEALSNSAVTQALDPAPYEALERLQPGAGERLLDGLGVELAAVAPLVPEAARRGDVALARALADRLASAAATAGARPLAEALVTLRARLTDLDADAWAAAWRDCAARIEATLAALDRRQRRQPWDAARDDPRAIRRVADALRQQPGMMAALEASPDPACIVTARRQIVAANRAMCTLVEAAEPEWLLGRRPGEVVGCPHAAVPEGCGQGAHCSFCGAVRAIHHALASGCVQEEDAAIERRQGRPPTIPCRVRAAPFHLGGERLAWVVLRSLQPDLESCLLRDGLTQLAAAAASERAADAQAARERAEAILAVLDPAAAPAPVVLDTAEVVRAAAERVRARMPARAGRLLVQVQEGLHAEGQRALVLTVMQELIEHALAAGLEDTTVCAGNRDEAVSVACWVRWPGTIPESWRHRWHLPGIGPAADGRPAVPCLARWLADDRGRAKVVCTGAALTGTEFAVWLPRVPG